MGNQKTWQSSTWDTYSIEDHPFKTIVPSSAKYLVIGTFPTFKENRLYDFFYSAKENYFWKIIEQIFNHSFTYQSGVNAKIEREQFVNDKLIGMTDMHEKCYRKNKSSSDKDLYPIILKDIFGILNQHASIERIILTSRTEVFGALGLFKTYFLQQRRELLEIKTRKDNIQEASFFLESKRIDLVIPYSPSPRLISEGRTTMNQLVQMYKYCFRQ